VFNKALALETANHAAGNKFIRYVEMANMLPLWKNEFAWLSESPSQALQHAAAAAGGLRGGRKPR
jgi:putative transposase